MLNNEKIMEMTRLALYEQGEGKKSIPIGKMFRRDYVGMRLISSFFYITAAYIVCVALWIAAQGETFIDKLEGGAVAPVVIFLGIAYLAAVAVYMVVCYFFYTYRFKKIRRELKEYNMRLKRLRRLQEQEMELLINEPEDSIEIGDGQS